MSDDTLLTVSHLTKSFVAKTNFFGKPTSFVQAVDDVSFRIDRGEAFGLVGESGCGKTTIGKMIVGLLAPTSGKIVFEGRELTAMNARERRSLCTDIQLIFQDPYASLNPRMTIGDIVAEPIRTNAILPAIRWMHGLMSCLTVLVSPRICAIVIRMSFPAASASALALRVHWQSTPSS
jgi:peptide/nickel transport system ATP-binding protein